MNNSALSRILLSLLLAGTSALYAEQSFDGLAIITTTKLHSGENLSIEPFSRIGVILLAINACTIKVDGSSVDLKAGERRFIHGRQTVKVSGSGSIAAFLVIVNVKRARQAQTFDQVELGPGKIMEDASSRNETLVVALTPVRLTDRIDRADEGDPPQYGEPRPVELAASKVTWLQAGIHQITNVGGSIARFVTIEW